MFGVCTNIPAIQTSPWEGVEMFGSRELKSLIKVTKTTVECPVKGCPRTVERQRKSFKRSEEFRCHDHKIYISPSTFEYEDMFDNVLWKKRIDRELLNRIVETKRESRIARDNSEDVLTWNVFRYLEKSHLLARFLGTLVKHPLENLEIFYWSYSQSRNDVWPCLIEARNEFETAPKRGSEPDLIIKSNEALFFIEAKLTATNNIVPQSNDPEVKRKYEGGGDNWYRKVVSSDFRTVAVADKKYELLRLWLLGSWIAHRLRLNFYLVNLVPFEKEIRIEEKFRKHVNESSSRTFLRVTWEDIYHFILDSKVDTQDKNTVLEYFESKTIGYKNGMLQKAFSISH
jgi:hypothetical protein